MNQKLIFNTTERTAVLKEYLDGTEIVTTYENVPTVKAENGYYEVMQRVSEEVNSGVIPVLRVPVANTNVLIKK
jgi:hypothetical protein